jgi:hypothetical protein
MPQKLSQSAVAAILFFAPLPSIAQTENSYRITAMVYQTPPQTVTWTRGGDDGKGGIVGGSTGGMITSAFPDAIVCLKLGGPGDFSDQAIRKTIAKEFVFRCGNAYSQGFPADLLDEFAFGVQKENYRSEGGGRGQNIFLGSSKDSPLRFSFRVLLEEEDALVVSVRLAFVESQDPRRAARNETVLLDQAFKIGRKEPCLIGVPMIQQNKGKFVYWVALKLEKIS